MKMNTLVVIDDTGSPDSQVSSRFLQERRKTYVAMILDPQERQYAQKQLRGCLNSLKKNLGKNEFHFSDIYNRRGEWADIDGETVLAIFHVFAEIFRNFRCPFIVQTCDPDFFRNNGIILKGKIKVDGLELYKYEDFALFLLLMRCKWFLLEEGYPLPVDFVIDEGRYKNGHPQKSFLLKDVASSNQFVFKSSKDFILLQLVDFAAFSLNRMQHLLVKGKERSKFDEQVLRIISYANLNFVNIPNIEVNIKGLKKLDKDWYDYFQYQVRVKDNSWNRKQMIEEFEKMGMLNFLSR